MALLAFSPVFRFGDVVGQEVKHEAGGGARILSHFRSTATNETYRLLACEKEGIILYSHDNDTAKSTVIHAYDLNSKAVFASYSVGQLVEVADASLSSTRDLLVFSTVSRMPSKSATREGDVYYEAYVIHLSASDPNPFHFPSTKPTRIHLLEASRAAPFRPQMLCFDGQKSIDVYTMPLIRDGQGTRVSSHITRRQEIGSYMWRHWDACRHCLYYIDMINASPEDEANRRDKLGVEQPAPGASAAGTSSSGWVADTPRQLFSTRLNCIQYNRPGRFQHMFTMHVPLEDDLALLQTQGRIVTQSEDAPMEPSQTFANYNIQLVVMPSNAVCLCVQQPLPRRRKSTTTFIETTHAGASLNSTLNPGVGDPNVPVGDVRTGFIHYTIHSLHWRCSIRCSMPVPPDKEHLIETLHITFSSVDGYIVAMVPGVGVDMIDCGADHEPCIGPRYTWDQLTIPQWLDPEYSPRGSPSSPHNAFAEELRLSRFDMLSEARGGGFEVTRGLFDLSSGTGFTVRISTRLILQRFQISDSDTEILVLLHMLLTHANNRACARDMIEYICCERPHLMNHRLLSEFLLGASFAAARSNSDDPMFLRLLPLSLLLEDTGVGLVDADWNGIYLMDAKDEAGTPTSPQQPSSVLNVQESPSSLPRFKLDPAAASLGIQRTTSTSSEDPVFSDPSSPVQEPRTPSSEKNIDSPSSLMHHFLCKMGLRKAKGHVAASPTTVAQRRRTYRRIGSLSSTPSRTDDEETLFVKRVDELLQQHVMNHIEKFVPPPLPQRYKLWCSNYRAEAASAARTLYACLISLQKPLNRRNYFRRLNASPSSSTSVSSGYNDEYFDTSSATSSSFQGEQAGDYDKARLFHVLQDLQLALQNTCCPRPADLNAQLQLLSFHHMPRVDFMEHVRAGTLHISRSFAAYCIRHLENSAQDNQLKMLILSKLPPEDTRFALREWSSSEVQRSLCLREVSDLFSQQGAALQRSGSSEPTSAQPSVDEGLFPPLASLVAHIRGLNTANGEEVAVGVQHSAMLEFQAYASVEEVLNVSLFDPDESEF